MLEVENLATLFMQKLGFFGGRLKLSYLGSMSQTRTLLGKKTPRLGSARTRLLLAHYIPNFKQDFGIEYKLWKVDQDFDIACLLYRLLCKKLTQSKSCKREYFTYIL